MEGLRRSLTAYTSRHAHVTPKFVDTKPCQEAPSWCKLDLAKASFEQGADYAFTLDADAVVVNPDFSIGGILKQMEHMDKSMALSMDGGGLNAGVVIYRNDEHMRKFLDLAIELRHSLSSETEGGSTLCNWKVCPFAWEQRAFLSLVHVEPKALGDRIKRRMTLPLKGHEHDFKSRVLWLPRRTFNAHGTNVHPDESKRFVVHLSGRALNGVAKIERLRGLLHYQRRIMETFRLREQGRKDELTAVAATAADNGETLSVTAAAPSAVSPFPVVHMTEGPNPGSEVARWKRTWLRAGYAIDMTTEWSDLEADVDAYDKLTNGDGLLPRAFKACNLPVQKTDLWRYAKVYLAGGIYADSDVAVVGELLTMHDRVFYNSDLVCVEDATACPDSPRAVFFEEQPKPRARTWRASAEGVFVAVGKALGLNSYARHPQLSNFIFYATPRHEVLRRVADEAARRVLADDRIAHAEKEDVARNPSLTLEATGPGVLTDVVYEYAADNPSVVTVHDVLELRDWFKHHSQHTWRGADSMDMFRPGGEGARYGAPVMLVVFVVLVLYCTRQAFVWFVGGQAPKRSNGGGGGHRAGRAGTPPNGPIDIAVKGKEGDDAWQSRAAAASRDELKRRSTQGGV